MYANTGGGTSSDFTITGLTPRANDKFTGSGAHVTIASGDATQTTTAFTGDKTATIDPTNPLNGAEQLFTLHPATTGGGGGGTVPKVVTYISGPRGLIAVDTSGFPAYPIADVHGDIVANTDATGALTANPLTDEFGKQIGTGTPANRLGWTGNQQRYTIANNGTIRMGVRLHDPNLGRFLSIDPIDGGSANDYDYCNADPINCYDLVGTFGWSSVKKWARAAGVVATLVGVVALAAGASPLAVLYIGALGVGLSGTAAIAECADGGKRRNCYQAGGLAAFDLATFGGLQSGRTAIRWGAQGARVLVHGAGYLNFRGPKGSSIGGTGISGAPGGFYNPGSPVGPGY
jgi:RHS repeat-associated protein